MWLAIYRREVTSVLNSRWAPALYMTPLLLLCSLVILRWPSGGEADVAGSRARDLFALIGCTALGCILTLTPAFPAASVVSERRGGTLALLFRTPITSAGIYTGKFLAQLTCIMLPLVATCPAVAACYAMGGLDLRTDIVPLFALLLLTIAEYVAASLWVSCLATTTSGAIRGSYALVGALAVLTLGPSLLFSTEDAGPWAAAAQRLAGISPIPAAAHVLGFNAFLYQSDDAPAALVEYALTAAVLTGLFSVHAVWQLSPAMFDRNRAAGVMTQDRSSAVKIMRRVMFLIDPQRRTAAMPTWVNPVLVKELRSRRLGRGHWMARLVAACAIASLALTLVASTGAIALRAETIGAVMVLLETTLILLVLPSLGSGLVSEERESGGWALLCMTPMPPSQILRGKLLSVAWPMMLILLATLPGYAVMVVVKPVLFQQVRDVLITLILIGVFAVAVSAAAGAFFCSVSASTLAAYLVLILALIAPLAVWLARDAPFGRQVVELALKFSPVAAALSTIDAPGFRSYRLLPTAWWLIGGGIVIALAILYVRTWRLTRPL